MFKIRDSSSYITLRIGHQKKHFDYKGLGGTNVRHKKRVTNDHLETRN